ncbi:MAG: DNA polymerase III subunit alpha, partial [Parvibaculaceae bacterium]|nr:DNA polymerase III subunit alpha [Parvibaculaceae bacterium]
SAYSLLEGALRIKNLPALCKEHKMPALGIADTNNLFGALEFSETMSGAGIQPITGCSIAVDFDDRKPDPLDPNKLNEATGSLVVMARNQQGYSSLMKLSTKAFLETDSAEVPHIPISILEQNCAGLICLTGGPSGPINQLLVAGKKKDARRELEKLKTLFGDCLYVELQRHGVAEEMSTETALIQMAYEMDVALVATNEPFFTKTDEYEAHDALICISEGRYVTEEDRRRMTPEHYFKSQDEMVKLFEDLPEAISNTVEIARRCAFRPRTHAPILPTFAEGMPEGEELSRQAHEGLTKRLADNPAFETEENYRKRLDFELGIINGMDFPGYFLIVADFIKWAKDQGIPVGPGRGSGAGSLVAWSLTITDLDPLRFGLLFERFLNPERVSMPDFDIDFCQDRRDEVIRYVQKKYGYEQVAQIITFGKLQARAVLRDVGRVLQMPYGQVDRLCKLIPNNPANPVTLAEALVEEPKLKEEAKQEEVVQRLLDMGTSLEGLYRHASTHAAGVVIGDRPLDELVPLYVDPRSDMPVTQFNMKWVEPAGLVKFDFLGLKTLTVLTKAVKFTEKKGVFVNLEQLPLDDLPSYELLQKGESVGVFQLESTGMRNVLKQMKPDCLEDIIALVALYRPGPMDNIPTYIAAKSGKADPDYLHEWLETVLKETYGVIIYQEQVMQIAQILSGYSLGEADLLRRAMGKKIKAEMDKQKVRFMEGAVAKGVDKDQADGIFELVNKFAGYGFNKSHAAAYAYIAFQTAYMKANHPVEFLAASMSLDMSNTDKLHIFKQEADRLKIKVCAPCVNNSESDFAAKDGAILYALAAIKNVGSAAMDYIVNEREDNGPYKDVYDFARRMNPRLLNKRAMENLIRAGALDSLNPQRAQMLASVDLLQGLASQAASERESNQNSLFGGMGEAEGLSNPALTPADPWSAMEKLTEEFGAIGFYLSGHPLDDYQSALKRSGILSYQEAVRRGNQAERIAGLVKLRRDRRSARGNQYAFVTFTDQDGEFDAIVFSETLTAADDLLQAGQAVVASVELERTEEEVRLRLVAVKSVTSVAADAAAGLRIFIENTDPLPTIQSRLEKKGRGMVSLIVLSNGKEVEMSLPGGYQITPQIRSALKSVPGVVEVQEL